MGNHNGLHVENTSGWTKRKIVSGDPCWISFRWSSFHDGTFHNHGWLRVNVRAYGKDGAEFTTYQQIALDQEHKDLNINKYLYSGKNTITLDISDFTGNTVRLIFFVEVIAREDTRNDICGDNDRGKDENEKIIGSLLDQARDKHRLDKGEGGIFAKDALNLESAALILAHKADIRTELQPGEQYGYFRASTRMIENIIDSLYDQAEDKDLLDNGDGDIFADDAKNLRRAAEMLKEKYTKFEKDNDVPFKQRELNDAPQLLSLDELRRDMCHQPSSGFGVVSDCRRMVSGFLFM